MKLNLFISTFSIFLCASCASIAQDGKNDKVLEPLYGFTFANSSMQFQVKSNGCTKEQDFEVSFDKTESEVTVSLLRTKPDRCRRMPTITELTKTLDYSGIEPNLPVRLVNPLLLNFK